MRQSHRVVSHEELVREVVHGFFRPGSSVIRVHLSHLREKLGSDAWVIATIRGRGVRFVESPVAQ
jgi:DNA-binding response OmpR family regulator